MPVMSKALQSVISWDCADSAVDGLFQTLHSHTWEEKESENVFTWQIHLNKITV